MGRKVHRVPVRLDEIAAAADTKYEPALRLWVGSASRKVRGHIRAVLRDLG